MTSNSLVDIYNSHQAKPLTNVFPQLQYPDSPNPENFNIEFAWDQVLLPPENYPNSFEYEAITPVDFIKYFAGTKRLSRTMWKIWAAKEI